MHLNSLSSVSRDEAERVLASAALAGGQLVKADSDLDEVAALLSEIRTKLRIGPDDQSPQARARIDEAISALIDEVLVDPERMEAALRRAGADGRLPASAYSIEFTDVFRQKFEPLGEKKHLVKRMIVEADDHEHLSINALTEYKQTEELSLFLRRAHAGPKGQRIHWAIIQTHRIGATLIVQAIWRLVPDVVDVSRADSPLALLKAFAEHYGMDVTVGDVTSKFIDCVVVPITTEGPPTVGAEDSNDVKIPRLSDFLAVSTGRDGLRERALANVYCIDMKRYAADLRSLGRIS